MRAKTRTSSNSKALAGTRLPREVGAIVKDWGGRLPIALIYPNTYYLGMSNLGIHTIYSLLNSYSNIVCERVFLEPADRNDSRSPLSVESARPLSDFAVLAFSISYELDYFNVVSMLRAGGLPLYTAERDERHPLVIAGGPCVTANPIPLSPFFDAVCIGEAEPLLPDLLPVLTEGTGDRRDRLLERLSSVPSIYVPSHPPNTPIVRRWAKYLDDFATTSVIITPDTELGNLYLIEAERGCQRNCRFCLVNTTFAPMRFRSLDNLIEQAQQGLKYRRRIGLVGPAVADHPRLKDLLAGLRQTGAELSISSLRINSLTPGILNELAQGRTETVTIAPEAGSERLRRLINKGTTESDITEAVSMVAAKHISQLKLYFMLGLPSETDEDIEDIIRLTLAIKDVLKKNRSSTRISLNVAPFVPKAGTPFQWLPVTPLPTLNRRISRLKKALPSRGIRLKTESSAWSHVQGVLARGGIEIAKVLADTEDVSLSGWRRAVGKNNIDLDYYVNQKWGTDRKLPWSMIDSGTGTDKLKRELEKASAC